MAQTSRSGDGVEVVVAGEAVTRVWVMLEGGCLGDVSGDVVI